MKNDIVNNVRLDVNHEKNKAVIYVRAGDTKTRTIHFTIVDKGTVVNLDDVIIALITIIKPDGSDCYNDLVRWGNELHYTLTTQSINVPGKCLCNIDLTFEDGSFITIPGCIIMVYEKYLSDKYIESTNEYKGVTAQVLLAKESAETASKSAEQSANSEANAADSEKMALQYKTDAENIHEQFQEEKNANDAYIKESLETIEGNRLEVANNTVLTQQNANDVAQMKNAVDLQAVAVNQKAEEILDDTNLSKSYAEAASKSAEQSANSEGNAANSEKDVSEMLTKCMQLQAQCQELTNQCSNLYNELLEKGFLELGTTHATAYYGDLGQIAYNHSQSSGNPHGTTYTDVGADAAGTAQAVYENAIAYTDRSLANLVNGAPTTLDTIGEIAKAFENNADVVEALEAAIGSKANAAEVDSLINQLSNRLDTLEDSIGYPIS